MRDRPAILVIAAGLMACAPKASGPDLWAKACKQALATIDDASPERLQECEDDMATHPRAIADDIARCLLAGSPTRSKDEEQRDFDGCISADTKAYFDEIEAAQDQLEAIAAHLRDLPDSEGPSLEAIPSHLRTDPWGHAVVYAPKGSSHELCIVGPDGELGTKDDLCELPFIYFQF